MPPARRGRRARSSRTAGHSPASRARATGASTITTDLNAARVSIALVAGDRVECTFTNTLRPPAGQLFIRKITSGGVGVFDFDVFPPDDGEKLEARARTEEEDVPAEAEPSPLTVSPGLYRVEERLPKSDEGKWRLDSAYCNAKPREGQATAARQAPSELRRGRDQGPDAVRPAPSRTSSHPTARSPSTRPRSVAPAPPASPSSRSTTRRPRTRSRPPRARRTHPRAPAATTPAAFPSAAT